MNVQQAAHSSKTTTAKNAQPNVKNALISAVPCNRVLPFGTLKKPLQPFVDCSGLLFY
jgi:hypothetical protein